MSNESLMTPWSVHFHSGSCVLQALEDGRRDLSIFFCSAEDKRSLAADRFLHLCN